MTGIILAAVTAIWAALAWAGEARAQDRFDDAVALWLQGSDRDSLPMLAGMAREGDRDARLLLGRIETMDRGPSPYRLGLSREDYRAIFRSGTGRFGRSWIAQEAARGNDRARALMDAGRPEPNLRLIRDLFKLGERQASDHPTRIVALYGTPEHRALLLESGNYLEELAPFLAYLDGPPEPRGDGLAALRHITGEALAGPQDGDTLGMAGLLALGFGFGDTDPGNRWRGAVEDWLLRAPATAPMAELCRMSCGQEAGACAFALLALSGGYYQAIRLDSPLEKVIAQERFLQSPRARLMTLRRAALARREAGGAPLASEAEIAGISACAADLVARERAGYR